MPKNKTQPTSVKVDLFLDGVQEDQKRKDGWELYRLMERIVGTPGTLTKNILNHRIRYLYFFQRTLCLQKANFL